MSSAYRFENGTIAKEPLTEREAAMLVALEQFVRYATNGNHPNWRTYLNTIAGANMLRVIESVKESQ